MNMPIVPVHLKVKQFSSKSVEMSLRVASLDYLGIVAARLRRDAVSSRLNEDVISDIIKQVCIAQHTFTVLCSQCELFLDIISFFHL